MAHKDTVDIAEVIDQGPLGPFQKRVIAACALIAMLDGFDTQVIAFVAPVIAAELGLAPGALGGVFAAGLGGLMIGSLVLGPAGDRFGRKVVVLASFAAVGLFSLLTAFAPDLQSLMVLRFLTGLGLGGTIPNAIALTSEYAPQRMRTTVVTAMFCGFPLGASLGGLLVGQFIGEVGWRGVFLAGGALPLLLTLALTPILPESLRILAMRGVHPERVRALLKRVRPDLPEGFAIRPQPTAAASAGSVAALLAPPVRTGTLIIWLTFFFNLLVVYFLLNWLPSLLASSGASLKSAIAGATLFNFGGIVGSLLMARAMDRLGPYRVLAPAYAAAAVLVAGIGYAQSPVAVLALVFFAGAAVLGSQFCLNALAADFYSTEVRSTGLGWALGVGRIGSIVGPIVGSWLMGLHLGLDRLFLFAGLPALVCLVSVMILRRWRLAAAA